MTPSHLRTHGTTIKEYRNCWPDAPLSSGYHKKNISLGLIGRVRAELKIQIDESEPEDFVICRVCRKKLEDLGTHHFCGSFCKSVQVQKGILINRVSEYRNIYPNAPTRAEKLQRKTILTRRKNCGDSFGNDSTWNTRIKNNPDIALNRVGWFVWLNFPDSKPRGDSWKTRKERYPPSGFKDLEAIRETFKKARTPEVNRRSIETRHRNDPEGLCYKKARATTLERYGPIGAENPEQFKNRVSESWAKMSQKDRENRCNKISESNKAFWNSLSPEEKEDSLRNSLYKSSRRPNISEGKLIPILEPLGFMYNGNGPKQIAGYSPDFVHIGLPLLIEYDGFGGHNPNIPWIPVNQAELDDYRDDSYRKKGYEVLRLYSEDLKLCEEHIQKKIREWIRSLEVI